MNTLKGLSLTALLLAGSMSFIAPTQATTEAPTQGATQAPVEAPATDLTYESTTVTTTPAPAPTSPTETPTTEAPAPVEVTTAATTEAPTAPATEAPATPVEEPTTAAPEPTTDPTTEPTVSPEPTVEPACMEDQPCWNCSTMGNRICGAAQGETIDEWLSRVCGGPQLGDEWQGIMRHCFYLEALALAPQLSYVGSGPVQVSCSNHILPSAKYAGIVHSYTDKVPNTAEACATPAPTD